MLLLGKSAEVGIWGWWPDGAEGVQRDAGSTGGWVRASRAHKAQRGAQLAPWTEEGAGGLNMLNKLCRTAQHPGLGEVTSCTRLPHSHPLKLAQEGPLTAEGRAWVETRSLRVSWRTCTSAHGAVS